MEQLINRIMPNDLISETQKRKQDGYRLVAISCTFQDNVELSYTFDKDLEINSLRLNIEPDVEVESISFIYPYAFLYENEIKELFGVCIRNISLDYNNNLYHIAEKTPFRNVKEEKDT